MKAALSSRPTWATKNENLSREKFAICVGLHLHGITNRLQRSLAVAGSQQGNIDEL